MKKLVLVAHMAMITYLSNTPHLFVSKPASWLNAPSYEESVAFADIFQSTSSFFFLYSDMESFEFILHKLSHIVAYALLGFLIYVNIKHRVTNPVKLYFSVSSLVFLFALMDEVHQYFVVGRSGRMLDVCLDTMSAMIFLSFVMIKQSFKNPEKD